MPDQSIRLQRDSEGNLEKIEKTIGDKILLFGFSDKENRAVHINTFSLKDRLYSSDDLWIPKVQRIAACRQVNAIFKKEKSQNGKLQPSQPQLTFSFQI